MTEELSYPEFVKTDADKKAYDVARLGGWEIWVRNYTDLRAIELGYYFSIKRAQYVRDFFEKVLFIEPGVPFTLLDFQWTDIIGPIFGWCRPNGKRRFSGSYVEIPKGHGKTLLAAGIGLYLLVRDGRYRACVYAAAADRIQSSGIFKEAANLVANSPILRKDILKTIPSKNLINVMGKNGTPTGGTMKALSKAPNNQGLSHVQGMIFEELHTFKDKDAFGSLRYATSKKEVASDHDTPLIFMITTAGGDLTGIGYEEHEYARKLLNNELPEIDLHHHAVIYSVPEDADVFDVEVVRKANPGWGKSVDPELTENEIKKAKVSPTEEIILRRYRCNQWIGGYDKPWIAPNLWKSAGPRWPVEELVGRECYGGLDLASTTDLSAFVLVFPQAEDNSYHLLPFYFAPEKVAEARQRQNRNTPYQKWGMIDLYPQVTLPLPKDAPKGTQPRILPAAPLIFLTPGDVVDYDFIRAKINELSQFFGIRQIAIDKAWQGQPMMNNLVADGFDVMEFGQAHGAMAIPVKTFEVNACNGKLRHSNHPILAWNLANVRLNTDSYGNSKLDKKKSKDKIDGAVASVMALALATNNSFVEPQFFIPK